MVEEEEIMKFLANVEDPEMKISVIDLGLIYGLKIESAHVEIDMTLTSPGCPVAPELMAAVGMPQPRPNTSLWETAGV